MSETAEQQGGSIDCDVHLQAEIEVLKQALVDKQSQLIAMETACLRESDRQVELEDSIIAWQDKYDRLYESHKRVQKVNQTLEDKLLKLVDRNSGERAQLTSDVATLSVRLAQANYNIAKLQHEIERYKTDINLAIQLLQCKPDSFVPQKVSSLPVEIQSKVSTYMRLETNSHSDSEGSTSGVGLATSGSYKVLPASDSPPPICPFPPTAMVYSMRGLDARNNSDCNGNADQMISPSAMAKYLQDELKASEVKHCDTCNCSPKDLTVLVDEAKTYTVGTQTLVQSESGNSLCLRCNSNLNSPSRTNSPYIMKIVKSSDSVISETKSSVSDLLDNEKLFTPAKKDDLMVNPILGHHRLCDRTISKQQQQQICDTAKYIVETRKLENEIADLRKFNNKSPNLTLGAELCNSFSRNIQAESELITMTSMGIVAPNGSAVLLSDSADDNEADTSKHSLQSSQQLSEKDTHSTPINEATDTESKPETKVEPDSNSIHDSSDKNIGDMKNVITGSTNSIWSKTSSSDGAKIFENFNRNLIKTIKAENPTHRGPRLCALRIQNGSNNILLDNIDSEITPVVYTRPTRFLDEELDDSKDVITSKISLLMSKHDPSSSTTSSQINSSGVDQLSTNIINHQQSGTIKNSTIEPDNLADVSNVIDLLDSSINIAGPGNDQYCDAVHSVLNISSLDINLDTHQQHLQQAFQQQLQQCQRSHKMNALEVQLGKIGNNLILDTEIENDRKTPLLVLDHSRNPLIHSSNCVEQQQHWNGFLVDVHQNQQNKQHYELLMLAGDHSLNSSFKNTTSKSGTQSSSISSCGIDVDVQETAVLRRQQLTRVAEWVQNSSIQQHHSELKILPSKQYCNSMSLSTINHNNYGILPETSLSHVSNNSMEKFSTPDSARFLTTKPIYLSGVHSTLNNNFHHFQSNLQQQLVNNINESTAEGRQKFKVTPLSNNYASIDQNHCLQHNDAAAAQTVRKIFLPIKMDDPINANQMNSPDQSNVDLAQMEYNVKQFLLKQNDWGIRNVNKSQNSLQSGAEGEKLASVASVTGRNNISNSNNDQCVTFKNHSLPIRTETNL